MKTVEVIKKNAVNNIWMTILLILTVTTQIGELALDAFSEMNLKWLPNLVSILTFVLAAYKLYVLPYFNPEDVVKYKDDLDDKNINKYFVPNNRSTVINWFLYRL